MEGKILIADDETDIVVMLNSNKHHDFITAFNLIVYSHLLDWVALPTRVLYFPALIAVTNCTSPDVPLPVPHSQHLPVSVSLFSGKLSA